MQTNANNCKQIRKQLRHPNIAKQCETIKTIKC